MRAFQLPKISVEWGQSCIRSLKHVRQATRRATGEALGPCIKLLSLSSVASVPSLKGNYKYDRPHHMLGEVDGHIEYANWLFQISHARRSSSGGKKGTSRQQK